MKSIVSQNPLSFLLLVLFSVSLFISACSKEDTLETDAELIPYFQIFADEAALRGIDVDYEEARIEGLLQDITRNQVLGQCFRNEERPKKVIIDREYWANANEFERQFLIFHELGHCFLLLEHDDRLDFDTNTCLSIMHSTSDSCPFELNDDNRERYLDELFSK